MISKIKKFKKRKNLEQPVIAIVFGVLTFGLIALLVFSNFRINQRRSELLDQISDLDSQIRALKERNEELSEKIEESQTDAHWEEKIREQGYKKPGEEQVVVLPPAETSQESSQDQKSIWQTILEKIRF